MHSVIHTAHVSEAAKPDTLLQQSSPIPQPYVLNSDLLSSEDRLILYAALQDIANELRRIRHERKKNQPAK